MSDIGHNSNPQLKSFIERIERLLEEKEALSADIREVYSEAKSSGLDTKIMRRVIADRKLDAAERAERDALVEAYAAALGDFVTAPLGQAAMSKVA